MLIQARRHEIAEQANVNDRKLYETKQAQLEHEIEQAQGVLTNSKLELEAAREEKRQKNECEVRLVKRCVPVPLHMLIEIDFRLLQKACPCTQIMMHMPVKKCGLVNFRYGG